MAFRNLAKTVEDVLRKVRIRIKVQEVDHPDGRVVILKVPPRPLGVPVDVRGAYWMRAGQELTTMTPEVLRSIFDEGVTDYSATICDGATLSDLDSDAIESFRSLWQRKSRNEGLAELSQEQLLEDAGLLVDGAPTVAALVLLGTHNGLRRHLAHAEVVYEYRSADEAISSGQRVEFRRAFLAFYDELWDLIGLRNEVQHYQEGLFVRDIATFNERACREAILNAVSHRDYRSAGSVFVRQFPRRLLVESPGGFPEGVTEDNILFRQVPRNRLLAENLAKCGFVERSGQGADLMFRLCIEEGKARPDFTHTDAQCVYLTLHGTVQDPQFVRFLEQVSKQKGQPFGLNDLLVLSLVREGLQVPENLTSGVRRLLDAGVLERVARRRLILSRRFYGFLKKSGEYTRRKGLDRETNKALLLQHIKDNAQRGSRKAELLEVLPSLTNDQVSGLLRDLKNEEKIHPEGQTRAARWFPSPLRHHDNE